MRQYIKKLQSKPEHIKKQILVGSLVLSMFFVGFVWVSGLNSKFSQPKPVVAEKTMNPFNVLKQSIGETYTNVTASVGNITSMKKQIEKEVQPKVENDKQIDLIPVQNQ